MRVIRSDMEKRSLKERLVAYFKKRHTDWTPSGELQRLVMQYTDYTPRTVVRRLQELEDSGELEVKYVKGHAHYRCHQSPKSALRSELTREEMIEYGRTQVALFEQ